jgi:hypothetical protein
MRAMVTAYGQDASAAVGAMLRPDSDRMRIRPGLSTCESFHRCNNHGDG